MFSIICLSVHPPPAGFPFRNTVIFSILPPSHKAISTSIELLAPRWSIIAACEAVGAECEARACWGVYVPAQGCLQSYVELFDSMQQRLGSVSLSQLPAAPLCTIRGDPKGQFHHSPSSNSAMVVDQWRRMFMSDRVQLSSAISAHIR